MFYSPPIFANPLSFDKKEGEVGISSNVSINLHSFGETVAQPDGLQLHSF
jgi:hypothetical protein